MADTLRRAYDKIGIDLLNDNFPIGQQFKSYENCVDKSVKKNIEFFLIDFAAAMLSLQKVDKSAFNYYLKRINKNSNLNFWGEYFEMIMHYKFIDTAAQYGYMIRRGFIKQSEPDLVIFNDTESFHIEITTLKFDKSSNKKNANAKIIDKILEKNSKPYANDNCVLFINISNLVYYEKLGLSTFDKSLQDILESLKEIVKFNRVILVNSLFSESSHNLKYKYIANEYRYVNDNMTINNFFREKITFDENEETKQYYFKRY